MSDLWACGLFSLTIVAVAAGLCVWHVRVWRACVRGEADAAEFDFRRRQCRRRLQASVMLGLLGLSVSGGGVMMLFRLNPMAITLYWLAVFVLLGWLALLALADMVASKHYYSRVQDRYAVEQAQLKMVLRRLRAEGGNGRSASDASPSEN